MIFFIDSTSSEISSQLKGQLNLQQSNIGSDNGLVPNRRQPSSEPIMALFTDAYVRHSMSWTSRG